MISIILFLLAGTEQAVPAAAFAPSVAFPPGLDLVTLDTGLAPPRSFSVNATRRDAENRSRFQQSEKAICDDSPEVQIDSEVLEKVISDAGHAIVSQSIRANRLLIVTAPKPQEASLASYYVVSVALERCRAKRGARKCRFEARAIRMDAPFDNGILKVISAVPASDHLTRKLVSTARRSVSEATFWCRAQSVVRNTIEPVTYD